MGASIGVRVPSKKKREAMLSFLAANYREWEEVTSGKPPAFLRPFEFWDPNFISYEFAGHLVGWERAYVYSVQRWIALKVGSRTSRFSKGVAKGYKFKEPVAFMTYDGYENWPIFPTTVKEARKLPKGIRWCTTDRLGVYLNEETSESLVTACFLGNISQDEDLNLNQQLTNELTKLGPWPEDRSGKAYTQHLKKYQQVKAKVAKPEIKKTLPIVRRELKRLNDLWIAQGHENH